MDLNNRQQNERCQICIKQKQILCVVCKKRPQTFVVHEAINNGACDNLDCIAQQKELE